MEAQRIAMSTASENIANASTTRTADGTPYDIKRAVHQNSNETVRNFSQVFNEMQGRLNVSDPKHMSSNGLQNRLAGIELGPMTSIQAQQRTRMEWEPDHPHADENGYVEYPDINVVEEMARMVSANRIYEANLSAVQAAKEMIKRTLDI